MLSLGPFGYKHLRIRPGFSFFCETRPRARARFLSIPQPALFFSVRGLVLIPCSLMVRTDVTSTFRVLTMIVVKLILRSLLLKAPLASPSSFFRGGPPLLFKNRSEPPRLSSPPSRSLRGGYVILKATNIPAPFFFLVAFDLFPSVRLPPLPPSSFLSSRPPFCFFFARNLVSSSCRVQSFHRRHHERSSLFFLKKRVLDIPRWDSRPSNLSFSTMIVHLLPSSLV